MAVLPALFGLFLYLNVTSGYVLISDEDNEIIWPSEYHFKGEKINFGTTLKESFEMWYSAEYNKSRIDFDGGVNKQYYDGEAEAAYMVFPMVDTDLSQEVVCWGLGFDPEEDQVDFMPDVSRLSFTGQTMMLFNKVVDIWHGLDEEEDLLREQTLYVFKTDHGIDIPVQLITKKYNEELGNVASHVIVNYYNFEDTVTEEDVTPDKDLCEDKGKLGENFKNDFHVLHPDVPRNLDILFESYANHHSKIYQEKERQKRKNIIEKNWRLVHEHNRKNLGFKLALNEFSDRTPDELKYLAGTFVSNDLSPLASPFPHTLKEIDEIVKELPENYDLRMEGAVTQIKNQGECGSCWAFSTTAAVEGAFAKATGERLVDLSEQSLVDCGWTHFNMGCNGGMLDTAFMYVFEHGIPTEREYGVYKALDDYCKINNMTNVYKLKGFTHLTPRNPNAIKVALNKYGPVSVGVHVSDYMVHYANGLFYDFTCEGSRPNHAVTIVGYGVRDGEEYWIVKNSWGEAWGEDGYILMSARSDNCFILDYPYVPLV